MMAGGWKRAFAAAVVLWGLLSPIPGVASDAGPGAYREVLQKDNLTKVILDNGLSAVLLENHAAPVVALQVWVNVGSRYERDDHAGISHVFEHMLFKGTEKRGVGEIAREVEAAGGRMNAFTSFDHTVYHVVMASRYLDAGLDVLSDAVQHSSFDPEELARESQVVLEELKRAEDDPERVAGRRLFETAYSVHPYRRPVIGYEKTFTALTRADYLEYLRRWYVPNNISLIVVGDFRTQDVIPKIVQAFRDFRPRPDLSLEIPQEPEQQELRAVVTRKEASHVFLEMGYHIPGIHDPRNPAWDLLGAVLGQGETSRLYRRVKRDKELVQTISAYAFTPRDPGLFLIEARLDPPRIEGALEEILRQVHRLRTEPVSEEELHRARVNIESDFVYGKETMEGQARKIGYYEADFGDPLYEETYLKGIASVTPAELMELARRYLRPKNLTVSLLLGPDKRADFSSKALEKLILGLERKTAAEGPPAPSGEPNRPRRIVLANGIRLIVRENHAVPEVSVRVALAGGQRYENRETSGIYHFMASMLDRGTAKRSAEEIAAEIEEMAGAVGGFSGRNSFGARLKVLSRHFSRGMGLLADLVLDPAFEPAEVEKVRADILADIKQEQDLLSRRAGNLFRRTLYRRHPYGMRVIGEEETVGRFTSEELRETYREALSPERMVIAVAGDIREGEAARLVEELFGGMEKKAAPAPGVPREARPSAVREAEEIVDRNQAHMMVGVLGTTVTSPDRYPLEVLSNLLAGQGGRLFMELRDKQGLAYVVTAFSQEGVDPGYFAAYIGCSPEKLEQARTGILAEFRRLREEKVPVEELERTKKNLIGSFEIDLQTNDALAFTMALDELYGNGFDAYQRYPARIAKVTARDVQRAARKYLAPGTYTIAVIKPQVKGDSEPEIRKEEAGKGP